MASKRKASDISEETAAVEAKEATIIRTFEFIGGKTVRTSGPAKIVDRCIRGRGTTKDTSAQLDDVNTHLRLP